LGEDELMDDEKSVDFDYPGEEDLYEGDRSQLIDLDDLSAGI
jgi:hypothetical protein